jgi:CHAT domain-containing protein
VTLPDGQFLGTRLAVARRHLATSGGVRVRPPQRLHLDGVTLLAPAYQGERRLPAQQAEISAVQSAASQRRSQVRVWEAATEGSGLASRLRDDARSGAFALHIAGHGETAPEGAGAFRLDLGLDALTATEWRELAAGGRAPPFLFLNACNLAQVEPVAGVADGWAPASLQSGVAGFVGGLWPIGDQAAAEAARVFYEAALEGVPVAEALQLTRIQFLRTGDPTFLAYVYYGDPRLTFEVAAPAR